MYTESKRIKILTLGTRADQAVMLLSLTGAREMPSTLKDGVTATEDNKGKTVYLNLLKLSGEVNKNEL